MLTIHTLFVQANLPLDKFFAVQRLDRFCEITRPPYPPVVVLESCVLQKALFFTDEELAEEKILWNQKIDEMTDSDPDAAKCRAKLDRMIADQKEAVDKYGYLSTVALY